VLSYQKQRRVSKSHEPAAQRRANTKRPHTDLVQEHNRGASSRCGPVIFLAKTLGSPSRWTQGQSTGRTLTSWTAAAQSVCLKVTAKGVEMTV